MDAIILAGGLGTRLRDTIGELPKPMALVDGTPFLEFLLVELSRQGVTRAVLSVGYRHDLIQRHFGSAFASMTIDYAVETEPLGTGGAILRSLAFIEGGPCFVLNGDTFVVVDLAAMRALHLSRNARITMAAMEVEDVGRFGALAVDGDIVRAFVEKGATGPGLINAGVYLIERDVFDAGPLPERFSFETDFMRPHLEVLSPIAFRAAGPFIDIGVPDDYQAASSFFQRLAR